MTNNIKKNIGYQTVYNILITILPLITAPYLARHLGVTSQGIYSYTNSIVNYFVLFAMLGISSHGTKCIAKSKENKELLSEKFFSIYFIQLFSSLTLLLLYMLYLIFIVKDNVYISIIQTIAIISCIFDINWLFLGCEDFKFVIIRNIIFRLSSVVLILLFVKTSNDLWIYTLIITMSTLLSNITLWLKFKTLIKFKRPSKDKIISEIKPIIVLFIPLLARSVYHIMDKTMLGLLSDYKNVGFYYNADKVINIPIGIISGISTVLFPRSIIALNDSKIEFQKLLIKGLDGTMMVATALSFGIAAIANEFTPIFFGNGFEPCIYLIIVLSPVMIIKSISTIIRYQYLIPLNKENVFIYSVIGGALSNLLLNLLLIPKIGALGAAIGTLLAELIACVIQFILIKNEAKYLIKNLKSIGIYLLFGVLMYTIVRVFASSININIMIKLILEILIGSTMYILLLYLYMKKSNKLSLYFNNEFKNRR